MKDELVWCPVASGLFSVSSAFNIYNASKEADNDFQEVHLELSNSPKNIDVYVEASE